MRAHLIVLLPPLLNQDLSLSQCGEYFDARLKKYTHYIFTDSLPVSTKPSGFLSQALCFPTDVWYQLAMT